NACGPGVLHLDLAGHKGELILERSTETAKLAVGEHAGQPVARELPIVAETHGAEPAVTAHPLTNGERNAARIGLRVRIGIPDAAANTTEDVESGPARRHDWRRSLGVSAGREVGGEGRSGKCRHGCESKQDFFHFIPQTSISRVTGAQHNDSRAPDDANIAGFNRKCCCHPSTLAGKRGLVNKTWLGPERTAKCLKSHGGGKPHGS